MSADPEEMDVFVRASNTQRSRTLEAIAPVWGERTWLVVPHLQRADYKHIARRHGVSMLALMDTSDFNIAKKAGETFLLLDDSLQFFQRQHTDGKLRAMNDYDTWSMLYFVARLLNECNVCVSIGAHMKAYEHPSIVSNITGTRACGYRREQFIKLDHRHRAKDATIQLLEKGHSNAVVTCYVQNGECDTLRSLQSVLDKSLSEIL